MSYLYSLELTYIPSKYRNHPLSKFELVDKKESIPESSDFFLLWMLPIKYTDKDLANRIINVFPSIPVDKLRTCKIRLAIPSNEQYFETQQVLGKIIPIIPALKLLYQIQIFETQDRSIKHYSNSVKTYAFLTKFIVELLNRGNFIPNLIPQNDNIYEGKWRLVLKTQNDSERFKAIVKSSPLTAHNLPIRFIVKKGKSAKLKEYITDGLWHPSFLFSYYLDGLGDTLIRDLLRKSNFQTFKQYYSMEFQKERDIDYSLPWEFKFLKSIILKEPRYHIRRFHEKIIPKVIRNWIQITQSYDYKKNYSLGFDLHYPQESKEEWPLKFIITLQDNTSIPLTDFWAKHLQKKKTTSNFSNKEEILEDILRSLGIASKLFPPIRKALENKFPNELMLTSEEVIEFLKYPKDLLIQSGFSIFLPEVFTIGGTQRLNARLIIKSKKREKVKAKSSEMPSIFNINSMIEFEWEAKIKGNTLTKKELSELIENKEPLINWRGEWILVDQQDIKDLDNMFKKGMNSGSMSYMEALKLGLSSKIQLEDNGNKYEVIIEGDFNEIVEKIKNIDKFEKISIPKSFIGTLRHYQHSGLTWMGNMCKHNFGICLADDMGLGKTIQVIALLQHFKEYNYNGKAGSILIVCPTSVLFNWKREFERFAPELEIILHHGPDRYNNAKFLPEFIKPYRVFLTTFGTLRNDIEFLETINFSGIIIDEIQNIKNFSSKQTKAVYKLQANYKIGLSGTPIENRLMELWTLFEFLNPGLLGNRTKFQEDFVIPIERYQDKDAIEDLKRLISPFILRRLKTDKSIIKDLPEKNEMKIYVELSENQVKLYKELIDKMLINLESVISDKMNVLTLLVKLKQICNHPYQYLKKPIPEFKNGVKMKDFISESYKLERLTEMIDEVISNGEKALIFTQFKQMGDIIFKILKKKYDFDILFFHGGVPEKKRRIFIEDFQSDSFDSPPIMILSLKAGGTGLNLTQATTVFHYDRWWNPAVEDQATDRAYRIGQKSPVNVYKFITNGTIEQKIDFLLEEKRDLADKIVTSSGESWIKDLDFEKIKELFTFED
ncbi:MAG: DEAD/DEAH box helicase [Candidatus Hermodarchaeota archaeon]